ncbi:AraC family transcriptional regulator [Bacteroidota bacterium]
MKNTVSTELCAMLISYTSKIGVDIEDILKGAGIKSSLLRNSYERIDIVKFSFLWNEILQKSNDPDFGLNFGVSGYFFKGGGILASILKNSQTLGDAIEKLIRYHDLSGEVSLFELEKKGQQVSIIIKPINPGIEFQRHIAEVLISSLFTILKDLSGGNISFKEIHFTHPKPIDVSTHKKIFKTKLIFNQEENKLVFEEYYLRKSIFLANNELLEALQQFAQDQLDKLKGSNEWSDKVKRRIGEILLKGDKPNIEFISQDLNLSTRSLQNKLKSESISYQILLDEVRKEISLSYIKKPDITMNDLAFLLAFSDQSAFSHSFKRWTGKGPLEYRKNLILNE